MTKKRHWLWNLLIVVTVISCIIALIIHYQNWIKIESSHIQILSGIYYKEIKFSDIDEVSMVKRIPKMERINGFSAWEKEKGVFKDSLNEERKVFVYVDDLSQSKIKVYQKDSLLLYLNFSDSLKTHELYNLLLEKTEVESKSKN